MTALTAAYDAKRKDGKLILYSVAASTKIYKGALVAVTTGTGYAAPAGDVSGTAFVGVAYETCDNSGGAAGARSVRVQKTGEYVYAKSGAALTDIGKTALAVDDNTVATAATTNNLAVGVAVGMTDSSHLVIRIDGKVS